MFAREAHRTVLTVLGLLRADVLRRCRFLFGGGTRIVLDLGEYRESRDIDFLCSDPEGYSDLRFDASRQSYHALFTAEGLERLQLPREIRIGQYGIRFTVILGTTALRIELIREAPAEDLRKALALVDGNPEYRQRCWQGLEVEDPVSLLTGLQLLGRDVGPG